MKVLSMGAAAQQLSAFVLCVALNSPATAAATLRPRQANITGPSVFTPGQRLRLLSSASVQKQPGPKPPSWFGANQQSPDPSGQPSAVKSCHPQCWWTCGHPNCDEVCEPACAPPQCETACPPINVATCTQKCEPPKCAVVCPSTHCEHGDCPRCQTVCSPPSCHTECAENCQSKCSEPQCTWKCEPGKCEKPQCSLKCGGEKECSFNKDVSNKPPPFGDDMRPMASGLASLDPTGLTNSPGAKAAPPKGAQLASGAAAAPPKKAAALLAASPKGVAKTAFLGTVAARKSK